MKHKLESDYSGNIENLMWFGWNHNRKNEKSAVLEKNNPGCIGCTLNCKKHLF